MAGEPPPIGAITSPALAAVSANAKELYAIRTGGLRSRSCMTAGVAATTRTPAAQPKSTIADSPKTNANETPLASRSSTGTGKRSASSEAARNAASPARTVAPCAAVTNETVAATTVARPTAQTGATTGERLRLAAADSLIATRLPHQDAGSICPAERERKGEQRDDDEHKAKTRIPLQHGRPPSPRRRDCLSRGPPGHHPDGGSRLPAPSRCRDRLRRAAGGPRRIAVCTSLRAGRARRRSPRSE